MRADRLVSLMLLLQDERRHTAEELSRRLEVSPRTIYRDLDALSSAGVPVVEGARMLTDSFARPVDFELRAFWKDWCKRFAEKRASYVVTVRLTAEGAEALSAVRPGSERERIRAGTVTIDFERLSIALSQLVILGRGAEVLEPPELRARLGELARDLSALYGTHHERTRRERDAEAT